MHPRSNNEPTLSDVTEILGRSLLLALLIAGLVATAVYFVSSGQTPIYEARATLLSSTLDPAQRDFGMTLVTAPALAVTTYRGVIASRPVATDALHGLHGKEPSPQEVRDLQGALSVTTEDAGVSAFLRVHVRDVDPERAQRLANAVAAAAERWDVARATESLEIIIASLAAQIAALDLEITQAAAREVAGFERARADLSVQISAARALRTAAVGRISLFEPATIPQVAISPRPLRTAFLAGAMAAFLAAGASLLRSSTQGLPAKR